MMLPRLHVVTDDRTLERPDIGARATDLLRAHGARLALHLRGRATDAARLYTLAATLVDAAADGGGAVLVNDRVDVALAARADGVQLGTGSIPVADARALLGDGRPIGRSLHGLPGAADRGADFLVFGTVHASASHPGRPGAGETALAACVAAAGVPVIGIGGFDAERAAAARAAGAHGVAAIRAVWDAADPVEAAAALLDALESAGP